jgi:PAS domain S-box-containing protein
VKVRSALRSVGPLRLGPTLLVLLLGVAGYAVAHRVEENDRAADAMRSAQVGSVDVQGALADTRAYVASLGSVLEDEPVRGQRRFVNLARGTAGSVGLLDALWIQSVPQSARADYERRLGAPITRLVPAARQGQRFVRASAAANYLPATFTSGTRGELRPGVDVSTWAGLPTAIRDRANVFAVGASAPGTLGADSGSFLLEAADYGRGERRHGFLAVFVPRGRLTRAIAEDPRRVALYLGGNRLEGALAGPPAGSAHFELLGQDWRIDVGKAPPTGSQTALPWIALTWPLALAAVLWAAGRGVLRRRRAEAEFERMFQVSRDLLCIAALDGSFRRVNPAFEQALGYTAEELLAMPIQRLVHPGDLDRLQATIAPLSGGEEVVDLELRVIRADGVVRWLESNARPIAAEGLFYAAARDITDRRRTERELESLALEQAALRRVATLVARDVAPSELLAAVANEARRLLGASSTRLFRYEDPEHATVIASDSEPGADIPLGTTVPLDGDNIPGIVWRTGRAARQDGLEHAAGPLAARARSMGLHTAAGAPISVEGRLWGVVVAAWRRELAPAHDTAEASGTEARLYAFTELVATAVSNATARSDLIASRARIVAAGDEARRRIERNLHDGTQQQLIALGLDLQRVRATVPADQHAAHSGLAHVERGLEAVLEEIRELSRGLHPGLLSRGGLGPSLQALARRSPIPAAVELELGERPPESIETAVYYVVSETLANAIKHSQASEISIKIADGPDGRPGARGLRVTISDDGVGGARPGEGSGLVGAADRVDALGGRLRLDSPPGQGTTISIELPLSGPESL